MPTLCRLKTPDLKHASSCADTLARPAAEEEEETGEGARSDDAASHPAIGGEGSRGAPSSRRPTSPAGGGGAGSRRAEATPAGSERTRHTHTEPRAPALAPRRRAAERKRCRREAAAARGDDMLAGTLQGEVRRWETLQRGMEEAVRHDDCVQAGLLQAQFQCQAAVRTCHVDTGAPGVRKAKTAGEEEERKECKTAQATRKDEERKKQTNMNSAGISNDAGPVTQEERWERQYGELAKFRVEEGHCNVQQNKRFKTLAYWVKDQRRAYRSKGGTLSGNRAARLECIGFTWRGQTGQDEAQFKCQFKCQAAVRTCHEEEGAPGFKKAKTTGEEEERKELAKMNSTGVSKDAGPVTQEERWERNYEELIKFRDEEGHCNVPHNKTFKPLAHWVKDQRRAYSSKGGALRGNRVVRLESIGFTWRGQTGQDEAQFKCQFKCQAAVRTCHEEKGAPGFKKANTIGEEEVRKEQAKMNSTGVSKDAGPVTQEERWERNYEELIKFRDEEGHCNVPHNKTFKPLAH